MLHKALSAKPGVEMHHEYTVQITQPLAVKRYLGLIDASTDASDLARNLWRARSATAQAAHWGDSSNKLSWLIPDLAALFPEARFVHLVRDGRKVASSYFHKLGAEIYDDRSNAHPAGALRRRRARAAAGKDNIGGRCRAATIPMAAAFRGFDQFQRICWHWAEINRRGAGGIVQLARRPNTVRAAGRPAGIARRWCAACMIFWTCLIADERLCRLRPAAQCEPAGRPPAGRRPARAIRRHRRRDAGAAGLCRPRRICRQLLSVNHPRRSWLPESFPGLTAWR